MNYLPSIALTSIPRSKLGLWVASVACLGLMTLPARAVRFSDGTIHFAGLPSLAKVSTTDPQAQAWGATYLFTLQVPADASEPLGRVVLKQSEGVDSIDFNLKRTYAYVNGDRHQPITLQAIHPDKDTLELQFDPPVPPGTTVTLGLRPYSNPQVGGVYLFGVTVFPEGEQVSGQFIGYGRLQFYDNRLLHHFGWP